MPCAMILRNRILHIVLVLTCCLVFCHAASPQALRAPGNVYMRRDPGPTPDTALMNRREAASSDHGKPKHDYVAHQPGELVCRPFGECEPCPADELTQPFCLPFGNRRLLHCQKPSAPDQGEVPAWEACGKVIHKERRDFYEFVTCNLLFLIVALTILWARTSALAAQQYRQLAARIGIQAGSWRA